MEYINYLLAASFALNVVFLLRRPKTPTKSFHDAICDTLVQNGLSVVVLRKTDHIFPAALTSDIIIEMRTCVILASGYVAERDIRSKLDSVAKEYKISMTMFVKQSR